jgi:hypothetical protein
MTFQRRYPHTASSRAQKRGRNNNKGEEKEEMESKTGKEKNREERNQFSYMQKRVMAS